MYIHVRVYRAYDNHLGHYFMKICLHLTRIIGDFGRVNFDWILSCVLRPAVIISPVCTYGRVYFA